MGLRECNPENTDRNLPGQGRRGPSDRDLILKGGPRKDSKPYAKDKDSKFNRALDRVQAWREKRLRQEGITIARKAPVQLTPANTPRAAELLASGATKKATAAVIGCSGATLGHWLKLGEDVDNREDGAELTEREYRCWELYRQTEILRAARIQKHVDHLEEVAMSPIRHPNGVAKTPGDREALTWLLERENPETFGHKTTIQGAGPGGSHVLAVGSLDGILEAMDGGKAKPLPDDEPGPDTIDVEAEVRDPGEETPE